VFHLFPLSLPYATHFPSILLQASTQLVAKGLGRGITTGDMSGVGEGFASMGSGIGQGVETAVEGTVSGVWSVGKGVFSGVKSVGKGIGGVFTGEQERESERKSRGSQHKR
jgi:hypothetical protein